VAKEIIVKRVDDLDGSDATGTIPFAFDGIAYKIDVNDKHADQFRALMQPYLKAAEKIGRVDLNRIATTPGRHVVQPARRAVTRMDREQTRAIREWAKRKGKKISNQGRIPEAIVREYEEAMAA
jgi:Lsr2